MADTKTADHNTPHTSGPGAAMTDKHDDASKPDKDGRTPGVPDYINPATKKRWDEAPPGGVYLDGKTGKPHDAHGNALDAESLKAAGVDLSDKGKGKDKDKPKAPPTESERALINAGPAAVPEAPSESEEPDEDAKEKEAAERAAESDPGAPGRPTKAAAEAGQKAASDAEKAAKEAAKEKEKGSTSSKR